MLVQTSVTNPDYFLGSIQGGKQWRDVVNKRLTSAFSSIEQRCQEHACRLVVAIVPNGPYVAPAAADGMRKVGYTVTDDLLTTDVPDQIVRNVCRRLQISCIDQTAEFRRSQKDCYFPLDGHFNATGHLEFAKRLAGELEDHDAQ